MLEWISRLNNGKNVKLVSYSVNLIELTTDANYIVFDGNELTINNEYSIKINDTIEVFIDDKLVNYKVREIKKVSFNTYLLIETPQNVSTMFLTPLLGFTKDEYLFDSYLVNTYYDISETISKQFKGCLYLLYKFSTSDTFLQFEKKIKEHPLFVTILDPTHGHTVVVMKLPDDFSQDVEHIMNGNYSLLSSRCQNRIIKFHKQDVSNSPFIDIFNKSEHRRLELSKKFGYDIPKNSELYDKPEIRKEKLCAF